MAQDFGAGSDLMNFSSDVLQPEQFSGSFGVTGRDFAPDATQFEAMAPEAGAAPPQPSGLSRFAAGLGKEFSESPLKAFAQTLGIAGTGLGIASGAQVASELAQQTKLMGKGQKSAQAGAQAAQTAAKPAVEFGQQELAAAQAGKLDPALEATITDWVQKKKVEAQQLFASMGLGTSTDIKSYLDQIDLMGQTMRGQLIQQQEQIGLEGVQTGVNADIGAAGAGTATAASAQSQQNTLAQLLQSANAQLAALGASAR